MQNIAHKFATVSGIGWGSLTASIVGLDILAFSASSSFSTIGG
jgi:hypothetical protein